MTNLSRFDFSVVRTLRMKWGLTADQLAKKAGLTRATIMKIEGGCGNPTLDTIESLSLVFNLSSSELIRLAEVAQCEQGTVKTFKEKGRNVSHTWFPDFEIYHIQAEKGLRGMSEPERHENTAEVCKVLSGKIKVYLAGQVHELGPGMAIRFKALQEHRFDILETAEFLLIHHNHKSF
ncbi:Helix-turn-helix domain protein [Desulfosarcina cetonica]|uniref:XRE family transcriptional regulator n=1 Tax=Desulfosarcina cetonica TaxID=90730 RepID=UPI0006D20AE8|nr:XRE family transcriptional regulator [Desulfosarcina cetonica]VTR66988.1 Helix-turn-helix domain protein [Desulfosarcina cetonica]